MKEGAQYFGNAYARAIRYSSIWISLLGGCERHSDVALKDVTHGRYPRDSVFAVSANLELGPDVRVPFSRSSVRWLVDEHDTVLVIVSDSVPLGHRRLHVRAYQSEILNIPLGRFVVAVEDSDARTNPSRSR